MAALLPCLCALAPAARAASPADIVAALSHIDLANGTGRDTAAAIATLTGDTLPPGLCGTGPAQPRPSAQSSPLMTYMPLPPDCDAKGEVVGVTMLVGAITPAALSRIVRTTTAALGRPCFSGVVPQGRRRAPPLTTTAWNTNGRVLVLTRDTPTSPEISALRADITPHSDRTAPIRELLTHALPESCRKAKGG